MPYISYTGAVDGVNGTFIPSTAPDVVYLNGIACIPGNQFTFAGSSVVFSPVPALGAGLVMFSFSAPDTSTTQSPSVAFPTRQIGDIANWVAIQRLKRADLMQNAIENAFNTYNLICTNVPFEALQVTTPERPLQQGVASYDLSDLNVAGIIDVRLNLGTGVNQSAQYRRLTRSHVRNYDSQSSVPQAPPSTYARWAYGIEVNPIPDASTYTYRLRIWQRPPLAYPMETTTLVTAVEWDELFRYETLYRTLLDIDEYDKASQLIGAFGPYSPSAGPSQNKRRMKESGMIPRLWNDLLQTITQREAGDEDYSFNRLVRRYT